MVHIWIPSSLKCTTCIMFSFIPKEWPFSYRCCINFEVVLFFCNRKLVFCKSLIETSSSLVNTCPTAIRTCKSAYTTGEVFVIIVVRFFLDLRYFSTPAINRDWWSDNMGTGTNKRKVLSVQEQFNVIRATANGKSESCCVGNFAL